MGFSLTPAQHAAVFSRGGSLLVSAAAGSGKTAVLTQRVAELLCDESLGLEPGKLIVVTFTRAATAEMKQRVRAELTRRLRLRPENAFLRRQLTLLSSLRMSTIDALAQQLVREQFPKLGLSTRFRVGDQRELGQLMQDAMNQMLDARAEKENAAYRLALDALELRGSGQMEDALWQLIDFLDAYPFPGAALSRMLASFSRRERMEASVWGKRLKPALLHRAEAMCAALKENLDLLLNDAFFTPAACDGTEQFWESAEKVRQMIAGDRWDEAAGLLAQFSVKRCAVKKSAPAQPRLEQALSAREQAKEEWKTLGELLCCTQAEFEEDLAWLSPRVEALAELYGDYSARLEQLKAQAQVYSFSDLTRMAVRLLVEQDGEDYVKTPLADALSEDFYEIMVDECQDVSTVQNLLFWGLARGPRRVRADSDDFLTGSENLFLVGDVKQSIYRFRRATPELFVRRSDCYGAFETSSPSYPGRILLQDNFRSRREVCDAVNHIFSRAMRRAFGGLDYTSAEALNPGASYPEAPDRTAELMLVQESEAFSQADAIAQKIRRMLDKGYPVKGEDGALRPCRPGDFCVLLRSMGDKTELYRAAFEKAGVPFFMRQQQGYFDSYEVAVTLELLRVLDNPLLDVSLAAVLLSPMVGYTPDQLAALRQTDREKSLCKLLLLRRAPEDERFLAFYRRFRRLAAVLPADKLIRRLFDETGFLYVAAGTEDGARKRANLLLLLSYAQDYQKASGRGLSGFVRYLDRAIERQERFECAAIMPGESVELMTVHKSKGLEMPICFVAHLSGRFNRQDIQRPLLCHEALGLSMPIVRAKEGKKYENLPRLAIRQSLLMEQNSEELRILYVALTRAKEKLFLVGAAPDKKVLAARVRQGAKELTPYLFHEQNTYLDWLLLALADQPSLQNLAGVPLSNPARETVRAVEILPPETTEARVPEPARAEKAADVSLVGRLAAQMEAPYAAEADTRLPAKLSVTQLTHSQAGEEALAPFSFPQEAELSPTQRGTTMHRVLELCDFAALKENPAAELNRLVQAGLLREKEREAVRLSALERLLSSPLGAWLSQAERIWREYPFLCDVSPKTLETGLPAPPAPGESAVLLQGVVDLILEEADGLRLIDYKTDRVSAPETLLQRYDGQLKCYRLAVGEYFGKPVKGCWIYSFVLGRLIEVE